MPTNPIAAIVLRKRNPIVVDVELAVVLGSFDLAAFLQQIQNALTHAEENPEKGFGKFKDGRWWYYERTGEWERKLPMWSRRKLYRMRKRLSDIGVLLTGHTEDLHAPGGVICWYSIDEDRLAELVAESEYMRQRYDLGEGSDRSSLP